MSGGGPKPRIPVHYDVAPPEPPAVPPSLRALYPRGLTVEWVGWPLRLQEQTQDRVDILEVVVPIAFANGFNKVIIRYVVTNSPIFSYTAFSLPWYSLFALTVLLVAPARELP